MVMGCPTGVVQRVRPRRPPWTHLQPFWCGQFLRGERYKECGCNHCTGRQQGLDNRTLIRDASPRQARHQRAQQHAGRRQQQQEHHRQTAVFGRRKLHMGTGGVCAEHAERDAGDDRTTGTEPAYDRNPCSVWNAIEEKVSPLERPELRSEPDHHDPDRRYARDDIPTCATRTVDQRASNWRRNTPRLSIGPGAYARIQSSIASMLSPCQRSRRWSACRKPASTMRSIIAINGE